MPVEDKSAEAQSFQARLAALREALGEQADQVDDQIRERYSELLEEFAGNPAALEEIKGFGKALEEAVQRGDLPRAMVMRGSSRGKPRN